MTSQQWYYKKGNARFGPVSNADLKKLAASGKLVATDQLRGVGMTEWVPASKIKGLFAEPSTTENLKPAPDEKPKSTSESSSGIKAPVKNSTAAKPANAPPVANSKASQISNAPKAPPIPSPPTNPMAPPDPFAGFGIGQPSDNSFGNADPFASGNLPSLDHLVALEKSSKVIYREPPPMPEEDPSEQKKKKKVQDDTQNEMGPAPRIALLATPFFFILCLGFICGTIYALMHLFISGLPLIISIFFSFAMTSGLAKMLGFFSGNCLLKVKIKNEFLSLAYGGLIGIFGIYVLMAGYIWSGLNFNPFHGHFDDLEDEAVQAEVVEKKGQNGVPEEAAEGEEVAAEEADEEEDPEVAKMKRKMKAQRENQEEHPQLNLFQEGKDPFEAVDEFRAEMKKKERREQKKDAGILGKYAKTKVSLFGAFSPAWVLTSFIISWWFWLIHGGLIICGTAHSTWMSNLGHDPTRGGL